MTKASYELMWLCVCVCVCDIFDVSQVWLTINNLTKGKTNLNI